MQKRTNLGSSAEDFAVQKLTEKGYKIVTRNFRSRFGELDIVALDGDSLVFIEVKARSGLRFGAPEESVTYRKIAKIRKTSEYFCLINPRLPKKMRFEVLAIIFEGETVESYKLIQVDCV